MQQNGGAHNSHVGCTGCGLVNRQIDLLHRFAIQGNEIGIVLRTLVVGVERVTAGFIRGEISKRIRAVGISCSACQVCGSVALCHL